MATNTTAASVLDSYQVSFFYYVGVVSTAFGGIKLAIHAIRNLWSESVDIVEDTGELAHLMVNDVRQIYHGGHAEDRHNRLEYRRSPNVSPQPSARQEKPIVRGSSGFIDG